MTWLETNRFRSKTKKLRIHGDAQDSIRLSQDGYISEKNLSSCMAWLLVLLYSCYNVEELTLQHEHGDYDRQTMGMKAIIKIFAPQFENLVEFKQLKRLIILPDYDYDFQCDFLRLFKTPIKVENLEFMTNPTEM